MIFLTGVGAASQSESAEWCSLASVLSSCCDFLRPKNTPGDDVALDAGDAVEPDARRGRGECWSMSARSVGAARTLWTALNVVDTAGRTET